MLYPDNFFYFITIFGISISLGTYLFFAYRKNTLIVLNAIAFFLTAIRACTEYYLPEIDNLTTASNVAAFHSLVTNLIEFIIHYIIWFYIRPFRNWQYEKWINHSYLFIAILIPDLIKAYLYFTRKIFYFHTEKIDGYWQFKINFDYFLTSAVFLHGQVLGVVMIVLFLVSIFRDPIHKIRKSVLTLSFIIFPYIYYGIIITKGEWTIPNIAILFLVHLVIITWFVSDYRLFQNNFSNTIKDIFNSISDLAFFTDLKMSILHTNQLAQQRFAASPLINKNIVEIISGYSQRTYVEINRILNDLINGKITSHEIALVFNQKIKNYNLQVSNYQQGNQHQGFTFLFTDITEIREKEQALKEANAMKDQLFAIIGHDLRKPSLAFRNIGKKINYLLQTKDFKRLNRLGGTIEENALAMNKLIDNLLNWALVKKDVINYYPETVNLESVTKEELALFNPVIEDKQLEVKVNFSKAQLIYADLNAVRTIIRNLIDNAIKYTPSCGDIHIETRLKNKNIAWIIADTGYGIPKAKLATLFHLHNNKSEVGTAGEKGTGLGLHLVFELIKINKGQVKVASELSKGTTFEVLLSRDKG